MNQQMNGYILLLISFFMASSCSESSIEGHDIENRMAESKDTLILISNFNSQCVAPGNIAIWLPPSYVPDGKTAHSVIYTHDGQNLFKKYPLNYRNVLSNHPELEKPLMGKIDQWKKAIKNLILKLLSHEAF